VVEAGVSAGIALVAAMAAITNRVHNRISSLDSRVDKIELAAAQTYVNKTEYFESTRKLEDHMIRMEQKLDDFIRQYPARRS
jgi:uncharacterized membrane protein YecN with MAPEG domain